MTVYSLSDHNSTGLKYVTIWNKIYHPVYCLFIAIIQNTQVYIAIAINTIN